MRKVLLIGYGNPGRLDDGLGPALAERIGARELPGVTVDADYQLQVEDAAAIAEHDVVVFADAAVDGPEPFSFRGVEPLRDVGFSSHSLEPPALLAVAREMFEAAAEAYSLGIRGYEFNDFGERLSEKARQNLEAAVHFAEQVIRKDLFADAADALR